MRIIMEMDNGLHSSYIIDEMLIRYNATDPVQYIARVLEPQITKLVSRMDEVNPNR